MAIWSSLLDKCLPASSRKRSPRGTTRRRTVLHLTPLEDRCLLSAALWTQRAGDAGHSGYADVTVNPATIAPAWNQPISYSSSGYWDQNGNRGVAIDGTRVYRTELEGYWGSGNYHVMAFDLQSGAPLWNQVIVGNGPVSAPSVGNGYVYVNRSGHSGISGGTSSDLPYLAALDVQTGATVRYTNYAAQWESDDRPAVDGNQVVSWDGYYGGVSSWDATTLARQWNQSGSIYYAPRAAFDSQYVYAYDNQVRRRSDGGLVRTVTGPAGYPWVADPMVSGSGKVFYEVRNDQYYPSQYAISAYNGGASTPVWTAPLPNAPGAKAVGNGVVAVTAGGRLIILDEATGAQLHSWQMPTTPYTSYLGNEIVLTRTHAFVQVDGYLYGPSTVYAVNLATGQADWSFENSLTDENSYTHMEMALSGDRLVLSHDKFVRAFNVSQNANRPPDAVDDSATTAEDNAVTVAVLANDTDPDGDPLTVMAVGAPAHGSAVLNGDGTVTYTPAANYNGADSFTYTVSDGQGGTDTASVSVTVTPVNDPPVASGWQYGTDEDTPLNDFLRASDVDGDPLTYALVAGPAHGAVLLDAATGTFTYSPAADYNGTDTFTFKVNDGTVDSNVARVFVTVRPVNDAPVAKDDAYATAEDTPLVVGAGPGLLGNDSDVDGDPLSAVLVSGPSKGSLSLNADGSFTYTPSPNANGTDSFTYKASDGALDSNVATVTLAVTPVNDPPVGKDDAYATDEDTPLTVAAPGVLGNDSDVDGDPLSAVLVGGPAHGTLALNGDGSFTYTPAANYNGPDSFTYRASDGALEGNLATVALTVRPVNDPPEAGDDTAATDEDTPAVINVLGNDQDVDGDPLTVSAVTQGSHGSVVINANGTLTYTPAANYNGSDAFTYTVSDGNGGSDTATVLVNIRPVNDAPVAAGGTVTTAEDQPTSGTLSASDVDGGPLQFLVVSGPTHGTLQLNASTGAFTYTPALNYNGADSFTFKANDGQADSNVATVSVTVTPVNDAPVANDDSYTVPAGAPLRVAAPGVLGNDSDVDGDPLQVTLVSGPAHGTLTLNSNGSFLYTPAAGFSGSDTFTYRASDGSLGDLATVTISVTPTPATPGKVNGSGSLDGGARQFNINVQSREGAGGLTFTGQVSFEDRQLGIHLASTSITYLRVEADGVHATIGGTATVNGVGGYTFMVYVEDNGEPGRGDKFRIVLTGPGDFAYDSLDYAILGGVLDSGNIQVHKK
jgi:VCBS repeat-containing protein